MSKYNKAKRSMKRWMSKRVMDIGTIEVDVKPKYTTFVRLRCLIGFYTIKFGAFIINGRDKVENNN